MCGYEQLDSFMLNPLIAGLHLLQWTGPKLMYARIRVFVQRIAVQHIFTVVGVQHIRFHFTMYSRTVKWGLTNHQNFVQTGLLNDAKWFLLSCKPANTNKNCSELMNLTLKTHQITATRVTSHDCATSSSHSYGNHDGDTGELKTCHFDLSSLTSLWLVRIAQYRS